MQTKTISKIIANKIEEWLSSITDLSLRNAIRDDIVVTGGCITSMLLREKPNYFDIYFKSVKVCKQVAEYYCKPISTTIIPRFADKDGNFEYALSYNPDCKEQYVHTMISRCGYWSDKKGIHTYVVEDEMLEREEENTTEGKKSYLPVFITSNAITLSNKIQIITRFCGNPEKIHENFDFTHTKMYWTKETGVKINVDALGSVLSKRLIYSGSRLFYYSYT